MKFCQSHWSKLRAAMVDRGIGHLGAQSGEQAIENMTTELAGGKPDYDPLMDAHWMITNRALEIGGLNLMTSKEDGSDHCPVCEALSHGASAENWIDGPADAVLEACRDKGLAPAVS